MIFAKYPDICTLFAKIACFAAGSAGKVNF
jgi:hypothetical protein